MERGIFGKLPVAVILSGANISQLRNVAKSNPTKGGRAAARDLNELLIFESQNEVIV